MREVLLIEGRREAYSIDQLLEDGWYETMTVGELIEHLRYFDENMPVMLNNDNGYTYGSISESSFEVGESEDEEEEEDWDEEDDEEEDWDEDEE